MTEKKVEAEACEVVELYLLPRPAPSLDRAAARAWLEEDLPCWISALGDAFHEPDAKTREAFAVLAADVESVASAALRALEGAAVRFEVYGEAKRTLDFPASVHELARLTRSRPRGVGDNESREWRQVQGALHVELAQRLALAL